MLDEVSSPDDEASLAAAIERAETVASMPNAGPADAAPAAKRPSFAYLVGALAGGNLASSILSLVGGLLQARLVGPSVQGLFRGIQLVLGYTRFLQLGILNGLNRELPYFFGKGDRQRLHELASAAQAWALTLGVTVGLGLAGVSAWFAVHGEFELAAGWASNAVLAFIFFYATMYLQATYRTAHDFARLSLINVVQNATALAFLVFVVIWGFYGVCLRAVLSVLVALALYYCWQPIRVGPKWNTQHLKHLLLVGLPIFFVGELGMFWELFDGTLVWGNLGQKELGYYYIVGTLRTTMNLFPVAVGQVLYPRMVEQYGRTGRIGGLLRMLIKPTLALAVGMLPLVVLGWWLAAPMTRLLLPNYMGAVPAMRWVLLVCYVNCFSDVNNIYNVVRRQELYTVAIVLGMLSYVATLKWLAPGISIISAINAIFGHAMNQAPCGATLVMFPQAMLVGQVVYIIAGYVFLIPVALRSLRETNC